MCSVEDVARVRHLVQRILVPCVFVIGLLGNSVSVYVLTRKRMKCTTNIYLTALAVTDIIYLTTVFLLSLQHYQIVHLQYEIYWKCYGIIIWLSDVCAYISIYIAVCFTIERFIAIRYPLKRQTFCTEALAKKVLAVSTTSTPFEHTYMNKPMLIDADGRPCNGTYYDDSSSTNNNNNNNNTSNSLEINGIPMAASAADEDHGEYTDDDSTGDRSFLEDYSPENVKSLMPDVALQHLKESSNFTPYTVHHIVNRECRNVTYYTHVLSELGSSETYKLLFFCFTWITFFCVPLGVLGTFNCFLIVLVRRSKTLRGEMTNMNSIRKVKRKTSTSVSQENRITVTLIAVVICFIFCQLPWATYLLISTIITIEDTNLQTIFGNIFNLLAAINAAANFFLYCVLSDKYRKTFKELITGYRYRRSGTLSSSAKSHMTSSRRSRTPSQIIR